MFCVGKLSEENYDDGSLLFGLGIGLFAAAFLSSVAFHAGTWQDPQGEGGKGTVRIERASLSSHSSLFLNFLKFCFFAAGSFQHLDDLLVIVLRDAYFNDSACLQSPERFRANLGKFVARAD